MKKILLVVLFLAAFLMGCATPVPPKQEAYVPQASEVFLVPTGSVVSYPDGTQLLLPGNGVLMPRGMYESLRTLAEAYRKLQQQMQERSEVFNESS